MAVPVLQPLERAEKVSRVDTRFRATDGNIAAIDFGTTFCSLAYITAQDKSVQPLKVDGVRTRVPTAILLKLEGIKPSKPLQPGTQSSIYRVINVGYTAQQRYAKLNLDQQDEYLYFERTKTILQHHKVSC